MSIKNESFKEGDTIEFIGPDCSGCKTDKNYILKPDLRINPTTLYATELSGNNLMNVACCCQDKWKKISPDIKSFKVGDKVKILDTGCIDEASIGSIVTVGGVSSDGQILKIKEFKNGWGYINHWYELVDEPKAKFKAGDSIVRNSNNSQYSNNLKVSQCGWIGTIKKVNNLYRWAHGVQSYEIDWNNGEFTNGTVEEEIDLILVAPKFKGGDIVKVIKEATASSYGKMDHVGKITKAAYTPWKDKKFKESCGDFYYVIDESFECWENDLLSVIKPDGESFAQSTYQNFTNSISCTDAGSITLAEIRQFSNSLIINHPLIDYSILGTVDQTLKTNNINSMSNTPNNMPKVGDEFDVITSSGCGSFFSHSSKGNYIKIASVDEDCGYNDGFRFTYDICNLKGKKLGNCNCFTIKNLKARNNYLKFFMTQSPIIRFINKNIKEPQKTLRQLGLTDEKDILTVEGRELVFNWFFQKTLIDDFYKEVAQPMLKEVKEEKDSK